MKILLVEDEPVLLETVSCILEAKEYDFIAVEDGQYAWEQLDQYKPDLIITDIKMPRMTGMELLANVRDSQYAQLPVIVMSAYAMNEYVDQANALGISAFITKPFSFMELIAAIEQVADRIAL